MAALEVVGFFTADTQDPEEKTGTFTGLSYGTPSADRYVVVALQACTFGGFRGFIDVTLDGVAMTPIIAEYRHADGVGTGFWGGASIWICPKQTGTSGNLVVAVDSTAGIATSAESEIELCCGVYALTGIDPIPAGADFISTVANNPDSNQLNMDLNHWHPAGGISIYSMYRFGGSLIVSSDGLTIEGTNNNAMTAGHYVGAAAEQHDANVTYSAFGGAPSCYSCAVVSFAPEGQRTVAAQGTQPLKKAGFRLRQGNESLSEYTYPHVYLGSPRSSGRRCVLAVGINSAGSAGVTATGVTVGGIAATKIASYNDTPTFNTDVSYWEFIPAESQLSDAVVVTASGSLQGGFLQVYDLDGIDTSVAVDSDGHAKFPDDGGATADTQLEIDIPPGGLALVACYQGFDTYVVGFNSGADQDVAGCTAPSVIGFCAGSHQTPGTGHLIEIDTAPNGNGTYAALAVSFGPLAGGGFQAAWAAGSNVVIQ